MRLRTIALVPLVVLLVGGVAEYSTAAPSSQLTAGQNYAVANLAAKDMAVGKNAIATSTIKSISYRAYKTVKKYLGRPYCHGGSGPRCFDCSGLTQRVYSDIGIEIPRTAQGQYSRSTRVSRSKARTGDLVFFMAGNHVYHVGVYAGNGKVLHSPKPGRRVKLERIWTRNIRFGRVYN